MIGSLGVTRCDPEQHAWEGVPARVSGLAGRGFLRAVKLLGRLTGCSRASTFNRAVPVPPDRPRRRPKHGTVYRAVPARCPACLQSIVILALTRNQPCLGALVVEPTRFVGGETVSLFFLRLLDNFAAKLYFC